jgi:hypothetical protein
MAVWVENMEEEALPGLCVRKLVCRAGHVNGNAITNLGSGFLLW